MKALLHFSRFNTDFWIPILRSCFYCFNEVKQVDQLNDLIITALETDIKDTKSINTLFREDSLGIRITTFYIREIGKNFLSSALSNKLLKAVKGGFKSAEDFVISILQSFIKHGEGFPMYYFFFCLNLLKIILLIQKKKHCFF